MELTGTIPESSEQRFTTEFAELNWYAVYTWAHHERHVAEIMGQRRIQGFLPVYRSLRRWKDRRKEIEMALFPSYVFVHLALRDRVRVLEIPGVVDMVGARGKPTPLADQEIELLQHGMDGRVKNTSPPLSASGAKGARTLRPHGRFGRNSTSAQRWPAPGSVD